MLSKLKQWAALLKKNLTALYYAQMHPTTPWYCRLLIFLTLLYALSPVDLIPDFIPVLGLLDDLLLLPLAILLTVKLLPAEIWQASLANAVASPLKLPAQKWGILFVFLIWIILLGLAWHFWFSKSGCEGTISGE